MSRIGAFPLAIRLEHLVANEFADIIGSRYGMSTNDASVTASTDFVSVSFGMVHEFAD